MILEPVRALKAYPDSFLSGLRVRDAVEMILEPVRALKARPDYDRPLLANHTVMIVEMILEPVRALKASKGSSTKPFRTSQVEMILEPVRALKASSQI